MNLYILLIVSYFCTQDSIGDMELPVWMRMKIIFILNYYEILLMVYAAMHFLTRMGTRSHST